MKPSNVELIATMPVRKAEPKKQKNYLEIAEKTTRIHKDIRKKQPSTPQIEQIRGDEALLVTLVDEIAKKFNVKVAMSANMCLNILEALEDCFSRYSKALAEAWPQNEEFANLGSVIGKFIAYVVTAIPNIRDAISMNDSLLIAEGNERYAELLKMNITPSLKRICNGHVIIQGDSPIFHNLLQGSNFVKCDPDVLEKLTKGEPGRFIIHSSDCKNSNCGRCDTDPSYGEDGPEDELIDQPLEPVVLSSPNKKTRKSKKERQIERQNNEFEKLEDQTNQELENFTRNLNSFSIIDSLRVDCSVDSKTIERFMKTLQKRSKINILLKSPTKKL